MRGEVLAHCAGLGSQIRQPPQQSRGTPAKAGRLGRVIEDFLVPSEGNYFIANPTVSAATSAAMGVLTPMPCIPMTLSPWAPGSPTVMVGGQPALSSSCQLMCNWGGAITVNFAGQVTVNVA